MTEMDSFSLRHFLQDVASLWDERGQKFEKLSPSCATFISAVLVYDMHYPSSMAAILGDYNELSGSQYWQIKGGMDRLPRLPRKPRMSPYIIIRACAAHHVLVIMRR
jgi:hypothetical protein